MTDLLIWLGLLLAACAVAFDTTDEEERLLDEEER